MKWPARLFVVCLFPLHALKLQSTSRASRVQNCHIFTLWNYSRPVPEYIHLNLQSWQLASKGRCGAPVLVNRSNVRQWIPDAPEELFRIPYEAAESDAIRYALIYHNGGIYMDTDFLAIDMSSIIDRISDHDIIGYTAEAQNFTHGQFSSNFLAGKKGSVVMGAIWKAQKERMQKHCPAEMEPKSGMCCYDDPQRACSVRWAGLGEGISHPALRALMKSKTSFKSFIFSGHESFVPDGLVEVLKKKMSKSEGLKYWKKRKVMKPLSRKMYHLFNSQGFADAYSCVDLTNDLSGSVAGELYKLSQVKRRQVPHGDLVRKCANDGGLCHCQGIAFYGRRFACNGSGETNLETMMQTQYEVQEVSSSIRCGEHDFGGDPLYGVSKHCFCADRP
ncbi:Uncharacterized protein SCF082_LOCUS32844 [Durusdinium trenchii]|uniref:Uncharacterized protein n=1 Tax=Durusdinium trenchii TaxID=1381693 RepID=A0ABP0NI07_9DINO